MSESRTYTTKLLFPPCPSCGHPGETTYLLPTMPDEVQRILECGDSPSDADVPGITAYQHALRTGRDALNAWLSVLDNQITYLHERRKQFDVAMQAVEALLSPVQSLPLEVLMNIFHHSATTTEMFFDEIANNPLWIFGQVCSRWRQAALASSETWAMIRVNFHGEDYKYRSEDIMDTILSRSGDYPLSIYIRWVSNCPSSESEPDSDDVNIWDDRQRPATPDDLVLGCLIENCYRWRRVEFLIDESIDEDFDLYFEDMPDSLPMLEELSIVSTFTWHQFAPMQYFSGTPALKKLTLIGCQHPSLPLPWNQIIELKGDFTYIKSRPITRMLKKASSLQICDLELSVGLHNPSADLNPTTVPMLHTLRLNAAMFLPYFTTPELRSLSLIRPSKASAVSQISNLLVRSSCHLEQLEIIFSNESWATWDSDAMIGLFTLFPTLTRMQAGIRNRPVAVEFCSALSNPDLLPNLRELEVSFSFDGIAPSAWYADLFLPSLFNRNCGSSSSIPSPSVVQVSVRSDELLGVGYREAMQMLYAQGVDIRLAKE